MEYTGRRMKALAHSDTSWLDFRLILKLKASSQSQVQRLFKVTIPPAFSRSNGQT